MSARTLLVTLAGPQQAWGAGSRFATRGTERAPTRSGVLGLVAAALGLERTEPLDRLDDLRFGVRVDQPGHLERDFQTARTLDGKTSMPLSHRYYLADAAFLAGLESEDHVLLGEIQEALRSPRFPLYLGRRAFAPAGPLRTELVERPLREALSDAPWRPSAHARHDRPAALLDVLVDARPGEGVEVSLQDVPRSFDPRRRQYTWRDVTVLRVTPPGLGPAEKAGPRQPRDHPRHDPMLLVSEEEV